MPTIDHKDQPSIPATTSSPAANPVATAATTAQVAKALVESQVPNETLAKQIEAILDQRKAAQAAAKKPENVDWSKITEEDIANPAVFIPVIDHDIPDYMNMKLKDQEYMCVWANKDQRRLGALLAEGYELLKPEHIHPQFQVPLVWSSEKTYEYADVVCMRVHKSIILSKRRRAFEISTKQLKNSNKPPRSRFTDDKDFELGSGLNLYEAGT